MNYRVRYFNGYAQLPRKYDELLATADELGLYYRREWIEALLKHHYSRGQTLRIYTVESEATGEPLMMIPMCLTTADRATSGAYTLATVSHHENYAEACIVFSPSALDQKRPLLVALFSWLADSGGEHDPEKVDVLRVTPFATDAKFGELVLESLKEAGYAVQLYGNSYNQYERVAGQSYDDYLASRSSNQRYNSRRRRRNLEKEGDLEFVMITGDSDADALREAIDDYIMVAVNSWKSRDSTISKFILEWIAMAAEIGCLRLGLLKLNGNTIAAQFWVYSGGVANMVRTNFREDARELIPGVVLTNMIIEHLLDVDHAESLDLGYGDEDYKGRWVHGARGYAGVMGFNPATRRGWYFGHKHILGRPIKRMLRRGRLALQSRGAV